MKRSAQERRTVEITVRYEDAPEPGERAHNRRVIGGTFGK